MASPPLAHRARALLLAVPLFAIALPTPGAAQGAPGGGGVQVGDRIILTVQGEPTLSDTFTVAAGQVLNLPVVGMVPLAGVPRDELVPHLTREIGRYVKDPVISARTLILFGVQGEVARPGFYHMPADAIVSDVLEAAGGLTKDALLGEARLMRGGKEVWTGRQIAEAIAASRTLDEAGIRAGDQLQIPRREKGTSFYEVARTVAVVLSIPLTIYAIAEIIREE
jgi:polysaccharide export outer membrane protein